MTTVTFDDKQFIVPQTWNDLSLQQQLSCYAIIMRDVPGLFDPMEVIPLKKLQLIQALFGVDEKFMQRWEADCIQAHGKEDARTVFISELDEVMQVANFLFEEQEEGGVSIRLGLTKCPWPYIQYGRKKNKKPLRWYGPKDSLENMTIYELGVTFTIFEQYVKEEDDDKRKELANKLIATLYRPPKPKTNANIRSDFEGDIRLPLMKHETTVDKRAKMMTSLAPLVAQLMMFWFASCRQSIIDGYPNVFSQSSGKGDSNPYGWGAVLLNLSDGIIHLDSVAQRPYQDALTYISYLEDQRKKEELKRIGQK